jgi:hypothetical protein
MEKPKLGNLKIDNCIADGFSLHYIHCLAAHLPFGDAGTAIKNIKDNWFSTA